VAALPKGLPDVVHFETGCNTPSPLDALPEVPDDLDFAIRKTSELGKKADAWRKKQLKILVKMTRSA